ncbi:hypothetical protein [Streptomyces sp. NPDC057002]|uniref:hypothetical protein n=1 Tax=Streptomyces sp. NPDC057002 TaxID=3345992 RepID=UPI00362D1651
MVPQGAAAKSAAASAFSTVSFEAPLRISDQMLAGEDAHSVGRDRGGERSASLRQPFMAYLDTGGGCRLRLHSCTGSVEREREGPNPSRSGT